MVVILVRFINTLTKNKTMNLEEIIRIHGKINKFMGQHIITLVSSLFTPQEIVEKAEKLNLVDPFLDALTTIDVLPEFKLDSEITKNAYLKLRSLSIYTSKDLDELLKLDFVAIATKVMQKQFKKYILNGIEPSEEETKKQIDESIGDKKASFDLLKSLGVPVISRNFNHKELVEETIKKAFVPLYNSLNEKTKEEQEQIKKERFDKIYADLKSFSGPKYAWALLTSDDLLKNTFAFSALKGTPSTTANHASHSLEILYDETIKAQKEIRKLQKESGRNQKEIEQNKNYQNELRKDIEELKDKIKFFESQPPKEIVVEKEVFVQTDDSKALDGLINEIQEVKRHYDEKNSKLGKELANCIEKNQNMEQKLKEALSKSDGLNADSGIQIYVTPELKERYVRTLAKYTDSMMNGDSFSEIIDMLISKFCSAIKERGKAQTLLELTDHMKEAHAHVYKHNSPPAKFTRLFLSIENDNLTIVDIFTPEDHKQSVQNGTGRYFESTNGNVSYTTEQNKLIQIKKTIRELFEK